MSKISSLNVRIRTLTPLWTGGVDGTMDRIHETGIIGSLRWWYEAIVRGLGGEACDPTGKGKCEYNPKDNRPPEEQLCPACYVFGTTGWKRRFRLEIVESDGLRDAKIRGIIKADRSYKGSKGNPRTPTWYFLEPVSSNPIRPKTGDFSIKIQSFDCNFPPEIIAALIRLITNWGALGAKTQMGFGISEMMNKINPQCFIDLMKNISGRYSPTDMPSLQNIFMTRISPKNGKKFTEQETFNLKYDLRRLFTNSNIRHFVMGKVYSSGPNKGKRIGSKIKISRPYNNGYEMRLWGWIPELTTLDGWNREENVDKIYKYIKENYNIHTWREFNSNRDTVLPNNTNYFMFVKSLMD